jgi:hypothetical protein
MPCRAHAFAVGGRELFSSKRHPLFKHNTKGMEPTGETFSEGPPPPTDAELLARFLAGSQP